MSVPIQPNYDSGFGPDDEGERWQINVQPVIPISISEEWNVISRTILPIVHQDDLFPGTGSQSGIGDVVQSLFFSPKALTASGWIWGAGPVLLLPTGSDDLLTADQWGAGPTAVVLNAVATTVAAGGYHSMATDTTGALWTWGFNTDGQLGDGTLVSRAVPAMVPTLSGLERVAGGLAFTAALAADGVVSTWGKNVAGQLGDGTTVPTPNADRHQRPRHAREDRAPRAEPGQRHLSH